jgi:tol-pal system-associated acyl-CoA thioesterase
MSNLEIRIYYEDTDSEGVVYYANYLKFLERGRTEFLRELGFDLEEIKNEFSLIFAVKSVNAEYMSPARLNDLILIKTQVKKYGKVSIEFDQMIIRYYLEVL